MVCWTRVQIVTKGFPFQSQGLWQWDCCSSEKWLWCLSLQGEGADWQSAAELETAELALALLSLLLLQLLSG